jgi:hypothetical protein
MQQTMRGGTPARKVESALQNTSGSATWMQLILLWLAVGLPMSWGVFKALEDIRYLFH